MADELELDLELVNPRRTYGPSPPILKDLGGEEKTLTVERAAKKAQVEGLRRLEDRAARAVADALDRARPRRSRFVEQLDRLLEEERSKYQKELESRVKWLSQRAKKAEDELPNLGGTDG